MSRSISKKKKHNSAKYEEIRGKDDSLGEQDGQVELAGNENGFDKTGKKCTEDDGVDEGEGIITEKTFESLGVCGPLCDSTKKLGWDYASRIQAQILPYALEGQDVVGLAETGKFFLVVIYLLIRESNQKVNT